MPVGSTAWSDSAPAVFPTCTAVATRDDNRHGAGSGPAEPVNSLNTSSVSGADGYHQVAKGIDLYNWMEDGKRYGVRLELIRPLLPAGDGNYDYQLKAWIECVDATCTDLNVVQKANLKDTRYTYTDTAPRVFRTLQEGNPLELSPAVHADLHRILFGFTAGTGGASMDITTGKMEIRFIRTYPVADLATW